jgi:asparagine synthase (glutamine-hydrolysing)
MCGIAGYLDLRWERPADEHLLTAMVRTLEHRGPDDEGIYADGPVGLAMRRLSIVDVAGGHQPMTNEDGSIVLVCNGEIFDYAILRDDLVHRGHRFRSLADVEVLLHLYEEEGIGCLARLNGQFAFALYDAHARRLHLGRDRFGICPLHYGVFGDTLLFGSEIKAILRHPAAAKRVDLRGLDQLLSFAGTVSPTTMFAGISSIPPGKYVTVNGSGSVSLHEYWDLDYPLAEAAPDAEDGEEAFAGELGEALERAVRRRLQGEVPVGLYLSGGLDSAVIGSLMRRAGAKGPLHAFSITFPDGEMDEAAYQEMVAHWIDATWHTIPFDWDGITTRLERMIWHAEVPVKETYNTCSMALSETARAAGVPVVLSGEGADELFAGYVGYRFGEAGRNTLQENSANALLEADLRETMWGDSGLFYEKRHHAYRSVKTALYSDDVLDDYDAFDCLRGDLVNRARIRGRHPIHQRSYLDVKLRLADHLLSDHCDRMALAHSVEARFPFLDAEVVDLVRRLPPHLKVNGLTEKYLLRKASEPLLPRAIVEREKFGFYAPGSPFLLHTRAEWIEEILAPETLRRQGYFNVDAVRNLRERYAAPGFRLNLPYEDDLLLIVITFGIFQKVFDMPAYEGAA